MGHLYFNQQRGSDGVCITRQSYSQGLILRSVMSDGKSSSNFLQFRGKALLFELWAFWCSSRPPTDPSLFPAMSLQSAPLPLSTGTLQTPCTRVLSQPCGLDSKPSQLQHRGRWDGERWCALRARLLPFGGGMSVWDLCCCM